MACCFVCFGDCIFVPLGHTTAEVIHLTLHAINLPMFRWLLRCLSTRENYKIYQNKLEKNGDKIRLRNKDVL